MNKRLLAAMALAMLGSVDVNAATTVVNTWSVGLPASFGPLGDVGEWALIIAGAMIAYLTVSRLRKDQLASVSA